MCAHPRHTHIQILSSHTWYRPIRCRGKGLSLPVAGVRVQCTQPFSDRTDLIGDRLAVQTFTDCVLVLVVEFNSRAASATGIDGSFQAHNGGECCYGNGGYDNQCCKGGITCYRADSWFDCGRGEVRHAVIFQNIFVVQLLLLCAEREEYVEENPCHQPNKSHSIQWSASIS